MKIFKWLGYALVLLACFIGGLIVYVLTAFPKVGPADAGLKIEVTAERVKRGAYLVNNVAGCASCHSPRQLDVYGFLPKKGMELTGGFEISKYVDGMPGDINTPNLTTLQDHTDGELYRAIAAGVRKDGQPMFPMMPYLAFGESDKEDVYSMIAYLRSLKPKGEKHSMSKLHFPMNLIFRTIPSEPKHAPKPDVKKDSAAYGGYLVRMSACFDCHTPFNEKHEPLPGMQGAGGGEFPMKLDGKRFMIRTANISPDMETGIGAWDKKMFVRVIRERAKDMESMRKVTMDEPNSHMGYWEYAKLADEDLGAIYDYLRTLKPVKNSVVRWEKMSDKK